MRTNPFLDSLLFLIGYDDNYKPLGWGQYPLIVLFDVLVAVNLALLVANWRADRTQRTGYAVFLWATRSLIGAMWFQGSIWKLPLPVSGGFKYWLGEMGTNAAWPAMANFYKDDLIPNIAVLNVVGYTAETCFAVAFLLGIFVRPAALAAIAFTANIWLGLYHKGSEWPWQYMFLMLTLGCMAADAAGRALGLDAMLRRRQPEWMQGRGLLARTFRALT